MSPTDDSSGLPTVSGGKRESALIGEPVAGGVTLPPGYEFVRELGRGGMGVVYLARQCALDRQVAVKKLLPGDSDRGVTAERFNREALILARLNHHHIVTIHDYCHDHSGYYIVMEYFPGESLAARLARGRIDPGEALNIVRSVAAAAAAAHRQGIVHRDLKPANILLDPDGMVKVADFGIAAMRGDGDSSLTNAGVVLGTMRYMAPEQMLGDGRPNGRADQYALGILFHEMLCGEAPAPAGAGTVRLSGNVPPRLRPVIARMLEPERERRFPDLETFAAELESAVAAGNPAGRVMLATIGTGQGVAGALAHSIGEARPDRLILFVTGDSHATVTELERHLAAAGIRPAREEITLDDVNDHMRIFDRAAAVFAALAADGVSDERIVVDYTSGTKAMSFALGLAADACAPGCSFRYIGGAVRDRTYGRVLPGEEDIRVRRSPVHAAALYEVRFARLLARDGEWRAAHLLLAAAGRRTLSTAARPRLAALAGLAGFFAAWDDGDLATAGKLLEAVAGDDPAVAAVLTPARLDSYRAFFRGLAGTPPQALPFRLADALARCQRHAAAGGLRYRQAFAMMREMAAPYLAGQAIPGPGDSPVDRAAQIGLLAAKLDENMPAVGEPLVALMRQATFPESL